MLYIALFHLLTMIRRGSLGSQIPTDSTHVIHATHPSISYFPKTTRFGGNAPFDPWDLRDYEEDTGRKRSFRVIRNGRRNTQEDGAREVHFTVKGSAVHLYGAPKRHLSPYLIARQEVCIGGTMCQEVPVQEAYSRAPDDDTVLLWSMTGLDPTTTHFFILRLIEGRDRNDHAMSLQRIEYVVESIQKTLYPLPPGATSFNRTVEDTDRRVEYLPLSCDVFGRCTTPWESKSFNVLTMDKEGGNKKVVTETFMQAKTTFVPWHMQRMPQATVSFMGTAVYVFGAPLPQITLPHAAQEICLDDECEYVDLHQAYLNPRIAGYHEGDQWKKRHATDFPSQSGRKLVEQTSVGTNSVLSPNSEERSVLIWSAEGLKHDENHQLVIRMIERNPDEGGYIRGVTIDFIMYTNVDVPPPPPPRSSPPPTLTSTQPSEPSEEVSLPDAPPQPTCRLPARNDIFEVPFYIVLSILVVVLAVFGYWIHRSRHDTEAVITSPSVPPSPTPQSPDRDLERAPLLGHVPSGYSSHPKHHHQGSFILPTAVPGSRMACHDHPFVPESYHAPIQYPKLPQPHEVRNDGPGTWFPIGSPV